MPLIEGKSPSSFSKNVATEMNAGKPLKQSLAIAYAMKRKAQEMAHGGEMCAHGKYMCEMCHGGKMAEGGFVEEEKDSGYLSMPEEHEKMNDEAKMEDDRMLNQHGEDEVGAQGIDYDNESHKERFVDHPVENQSFEEEDMVDRIMRQRAESYSEGGRVSNDTPMLADYEENEFDDLVKDDDLEHHYTGANSGDEIGNDQEDEDRDDIISRIMRSRRLKDRMPNPM